MNFSFICKSCLIENIANVKHTSRIMLRRLHISQKQGPIVSFDSLLSESLRGPNITFSCDSLTNSTAMLRPQRAVEVAKFSTCSGLGLKVKVPIHVRSNNTHNYSNTVLNKCSRYCLTCKFSTEFGNHAKQISNVNNKNEVEETGKARSVIEPEYFYFHSSCHLETRASVASSFEVIRNYISEDEEAVLMKEVEPHLGRLKYEYNHWDDAIHGFRETERSRWGKVATGILGRVREYAFPEKQQQLPQIHVLDLAKTGVIKPHVDSVRFCGNILCGLCLLSDAVMRLVHVKQKDQIVDVILQRRSLYVMKGVSRYKYTHEILGENESYFGTEPVCRERRVSIMCRNCPEKDDHPEKDDDL